MPNDPLRFITDAVLAATKKPEPVVSTPAKPNESSDLADESSSGKTGGWLWQLGALGKMSEKELSEWSEEGSPPSVNGPPNLFQLSCATR